MRGCFFEPKYHIKGDALISIVNCRSVRLYDNVVDGIPHNLVFVYADDSELVLGYESKEKRQQDFHRLLVQVGLK